VQSTLIRAGAATSVSHRAPRGDARGLGATQLHAIGAYERARLHLRHGASTDAGDGVRAETASHPFGAHLIPGLGLLSLSGDNADNTATVSRDAAGAILFNGSAMHIAGGTPTVATTHAPSIVGA
jgi:hypothetical protein